MMVFIIDLTLIKTFNYIRIFESFSPIVTMLKIVLWQLRIFMVFFIFLILQFSQKLSVLGVGNKEIPGDFQEHF